MRESRGHSVEEKNSMIPKVRQHTFEDGGSVMLGREDSAQASGESGSADTWTLTNPESWLWTFVLQNCEGRNLLLYR